MEQQFGSYVRASVLFGLLILPGCGGGDKVNDIQVSPEAEAADQAGQKAMEEYMKSGQAGTQ